jgi:hypothetical protein
MSPVSRDEINTPQVMTQHEKLRLRNAAFKVQRLYFHRTLPSYLNVSCRLGKSLAILLGSGSVVKGAVDEIMGMPIPDISPPAPAPSHLKSAVGYE